MDVYAILEWRPNHTARKSRRRGEKQTEQKQSRTTEVNLADALRSFRVGVTKREGAANTL